MDSYIKNSLKIAGVIALLAASWSVVKFVNSYDNSITPSSHRSFAVRGEGRATGVPDVAEFTFTVLTEKNSADLSVIQKENTDKSNKVIKFVKDGGVVSDDIKSINYNISPRYQYSNCRETVVCPPPQIVGYSITNSVQVKVRDFEKISGLLGGVVSSGANEVSGLSFKIDDPTGLRIKAREEAIVKARQQAESMAKASGVKIGRILLMNDESVSVPQPIYFDSRKVMALSASEAQSTPQVEAGSQEVQAAVTVSYEIL